MGLINERKGTVVSVSKDKAEITILMDKGGRVKAKNEGFGIGDKVCFLLDAAKLRVIKVMSALTADIAVAVGSDPILQAAMEEEPYDLEEDFNEHENADETITWEDENGCSKATGGDPDEEQTTAEFNISNGSQGQRLE